MHSTTRIMPGQKWKEFDDLTLAMRRYHELKSCPVVYYPHMQHLQAVYIEYSPRAGSVCHVAQEIGLRTERIESFHSHIGELATASCCSEYPPWACSCDFFIYYLT